jgi:hypothetical protein
VLGKRKIHISGLNLKSSEIQSTTLLKLFLASWAPEVMKQCDKALNASSLQLLCSVKHFIASISL